MKNLSLGLNIILLVAVGVLFYLHFSNACNNQESQSGAGAISATAYSVGYINADSVLQNYDFFKDMQAKLQAKTVKLESEYKNRAEGLQREVNEYQRNAQNLTMGQAKAVEENLVKKQQNLRMYQESLSQELLKEESIVNEELYNKITSFLRDYSEKNGLEMVVKYNAGSDVLYANDSMNITNDVIKGLNLVYSTPSTPEGDVSVDKNDTADVK